jgi:hypothetical protein
MSFRQSCKKRALRWNSTPEDACSMVPLHLGFLDNPTIDRWP